jgi:general secretion pathway protein K
VSGKPANTGESGVALLVVVWTLALLSLLAVGLGSDARSEARLVRNLAETARARSLAEAGMTLALFELLTTPPEVEWRNGIVTRDLAYDGGHVRIRIEDEGGKVDLVAAPYELVANLLDRIGLDGDERAALLDAIAQRRQAAERRKGTVDDTAGSQPREPPFDALEALAPVQAFRLAERLAPYATIYTHSPRIDPRTARQETLLAVPGLDPATVAELIAARGDAAQAPPPLPSGAASYLGPSQLPVARIYAQAVTDSGAEATLETVAVLSGQPLAPFRLLLWRKGFDDGAAPAP